MADERQKGDLSEGFVTEVLKAHPLPGARSRQGDDGSESYMVAFGDEAHPAWMRVWPGGGGVEIESDWGHLQIEGISHVSTRRGRLWLVSPQEGERVVVEVSPSGMWRAGRGVKKATEAQTQTEPLLRPAEPMQHLPRGESGEAERVTIRGRLARAPMFGTTPTSGKPKATFRLGEHPDIETTVWHTVIAFGELAKRIEGKGLRQGQEIEIVGYPHTREKRTRRGEVRRITEVYATAVRTSLSQPPSPKR